MAERPKVELGDWITIGHAGLEWGVVSSIYGTRPNVIEIVHLNKGDRPLYEDVQWAGNAWEYTNLAVTPGFAKPQRRLQPYVDMLLAGRPTEKRTELVEACDEAFQDDDQSEEDD